MNLRSLLLCGFLCALLITPGCSSDDSGGDDGGMGPDAGGLDGVTLSVTSARSLDRIEVRGLPVARRNDESAYAVEFVGLDDTGTVPVEFDGESFYFRAPFHPLTPTTGGTVTVRVASESAASPEIELDLGALDDAPGAFGELVSTLRAHVDGFAARRGSSFEALQALSFEETPSALFPLKYAQSFVDDPENPNALASMADGSSDYLSAEELRLLDQICGETGLSDLVGLEVDGLDELDPPILDVGDGSGLGRRACIDAGPTISTAAQLSAAMWEAKFAEIAISGDAANTLTALTSTLAAGSVIPGYGKVFVAAGAATAVWQASREAYAGLNPSRFVSISADASPRRFEEDSEELGRYSNVRVVVASKGWTADRAIADAVANALAAYGTATQAAQLTQADFLAGAAVTTVNAGATSYIGAQDGGIVEFCPQQWTVDVSDPTWSEGRSVLGHFEVTNGARTYRPLEVEDDFLNVSVIPLRFGQESIDVDLSIGVDPISVTATPTRIRVTEPGEVVSITATIENAITTSLFWDPGPGTWDDGLLEPTNDGGTRPLATPEAPGSYPFTVTIESLSRTGLRADNQPPRRASVTVVLDDEIVVSPANACLENGENEPFSATQSDAPVDVIWTIETLLGGPSTLGSVSQQGIYAAPSSGSGTVVVVATSVDDSDLRGTATVEVGSCACFWALSISGQGGWSGTFAGHGFPSTFGYFSLSFGTESSSGAGNAQAFMQAPNEGSTGSFAIDTFSFQIGDRSWVATADPDDGTSASMTIGENNGETVSGSITGTVVTPVNGEESFHSFGLNFRSANLMSEGEICGGP